jgi:hypothetical protein
LACHLHIDADPDPAYHFDADADPDPDLTFQFFTNRCGSRSTTLVEDTDSGRLKMYYGPKRNIKKRNILFIKELDVLFGRLEVSHGSWKSFMKDLYCIFDLKS